ncbi:hypothetical protein LguiA_015027 [Lonicera macranthoides]
MGCCSSSTNNNKKSPPPVNFNPHSSSSSFTKPNRTPPQSRPLLDIEVEEKVKQVLSSSETPTIKPPKIPISNNIPSPPNPSLHNIPIHKNDNIFDNNKPPATVNPFDVLDISTTFNPSNSPATGYVPRRMERSRSRNRSLSFSEDLKAERVSGKSPARRPEPSPGRVRPMSGSVRFVSERGDSGESSGRRTMSPVRYTEGGSTRFDLGRSPSVRKTGKSPGRIGSEKTRKGAEGNKWAPTTNESLENPLVSLECFIFL